MVLTNMLKQHVSGEQNTTDDEAPPERPRGFTQQHSSSVQHLAPREKVDSNSFEVQASAQRQRFNLLSSGRKVPRRSIMPASIVMDHARTAEASDQEQDNISAF